MKARVSNLCKTEDEWNSLDFIPYDGELIVYAPDNKKFNYARMKIGDGRTPLHKLSFFTEMCIDAKLAEYKHSTVHDAGLISDYFTK